MTKAALYTWHELPQFVVKDDGTNRRASSGRIYYCKPKKPVFSSIFNENISLFLRSNSMAKLQVTLFAC